MVKKTTPVKRKSTSKKTSPVKRKSSKKTYLKKFISTVKAPYIGKHGIIEYIKKNPKKYIATSAAALAFGGLIGAGLREYSKRKEEKIRA